MQTRERLNVAFFYGSLLAGRRCRRTHAVVGRVLYRPGRSSRWQRLGQRDPLQSSKQIWAGRQMMAVFGRSEGEET